MNDLKNKNLNWFVLQEVLYIFGEVILIESNNLNQEKCQSKKTVLNY